MEVVALFKLGVRDYIYARIMQRENTRSFASTRPRVLLGDFLFAEEMETRRAGSLDLNRRRVKAGRIPQKREGSETLGRVTRKKGKESRGLEGRKKREKERESHAG